MKFIPRAPRHIRAAISTACLLIAFPLIAAAAGTPAVFDGQEAKRSFTDLLEFPDISGDASQMLLCASQIDTSGKMRETGCAVRNNAEAVFGAAILKAAKSARLTPAVINGKAQKIYLQFRVEFIKEGDSKRVFVYLNPGDAEDIEAYGKEHIAAQRAIGKEPWMKVCPARAQFGLTVRAHVDIEGVASNVDLSHNYGIIPTGVCQQAIVDVIEHSMYTPAMADGEAVPSAYVEPFGN
jgi:hypothetical protein